MSPETYWRELAWKSKRLVLLWLFILKTEPIEEIVGSFLEPKWIDLDQNIVAHLIPEHIYLMKPDQLKRELDKVGGHPSWTL